MTFSIARCLALAATASIASAAPASAGAAERIAFVGALSGARASLGRDQRDGFLLAIAEQHGSLGGTVVRLAEFDDGGGAQHAGAIADRILAERIQIVTGLTTSESALALHSKLAGKPVVVISSGAAPVALAAERCSGNFFSTAPVEDAVHENAGFIVQARGYETIFIVTSPESRALVSTAFRRNFTGTVSGIDEARGAIRGIRLASPDAVYVALPAREIRSFLESYEKSGLFRRIPIIAPDEGMLLEELGNDFSGLMVSARWSPAMELERSTKFVAAFERRYGRRPSAYALQGYEAALVLGEAFRALKGRALSAPALARALAAQTVEGIAGPLRFADNGFAVTQWQAWDLFDDSSGSTYLAPVEGTLHVYSGPHSEHCKLRR
ncbi:MAG TPA: ABC transporter substrate-binding protein [Gemmatimonadales bacterium]|nr:ABC transporter substrate-binding protein [Gemmatimonadales bacterium]